MYQRQFIWTVKTLQIIFSLYPCSFPTMIAWCIYIFACCIQRWCQKKESYFQQNDSCLKFLNLKFLLTKIPIMLVIFSSSSTFCKIEQKDFMNRLCSRKFVQISIPSCIQTWLRLLTEKSSPFLLFVKPPKKSILQQKINHLLGWQNQNQNKWR